MRSKECSGHSLGMTRRSTRTPGSPAVLSWADATASATASQASRRSQRAASRAVSTPIEQPGSNAVRYRSVGSSARLSAYLRASYQRSASPHGSAEAAYRSRKYPAPSVT